MNHLREQWSRRIAGPGGGVIPDRVKHRGPINVRDPRRVVIDPMAQRDLQRLEPHERAGAQKAIEALERGGILPSAKERELVGTYGLKIDADCRLLFYPHVDGAWHVYYVGDHDYEEAQRRMSAPRERVAITMPRGIPVENLKRKETGWSGRVARGQMVRAFRGFGTWAELKDALRTGRWQSKGSFTVRGEGETQFALSLADVLHSSTFHPLRGSGFLGVVEVDLQGLPFETWAQGLPFGEEAGEYDNIRLSIDEDGTSGSLRADTGLGIGINGGVPWDQVINIYELEGERVKKKWAKGEWERHIDRLKDNPDWYPENTADPMSERQWIIWEPQGLYYHFDLNTGLESAQCGWQPKSHNWTDYKKERKPLRDIKNGTAAGKNTQGRQIKPCPKCFPWARKTSSLETIEVIITHDQAIAVARVGGEIVGKLDVDSMGGYRPGLVNKVFVLPQYRRKGIATRMAKEVERQIGVPLRHNDEDLSDSGAAWATALDPGGRHWSTWGTEPDWSNWLKRDLPRPA